MTKTKSFMIAIVSFDYRVYDRYKPLCSFSNDSNFIKSLYWVRIILFKITEIISFYNKKRYNIK
ncbi:hypothetical protein [Leptospira interrogans]|uniref:hypothetical protein n=1 Tax=Leptospira interrogans TaxID=173 RepID=UPI0002B99424|nr:hypothetical protein [Leptospira interrogans]QOI40603.1 hypothetical protein Lepto1548_20435 [Leptospira interrogans serovar Bataviae]